MVNFFDFFLKNLPFLIFFIIFVGLKRQPNKTLKL